MGKGSGGHVLEPSHGVKQQLSSTVRGVGLSAVRRFSRNDSEVHCFGAVGRT